MNIIRKKLYLNCKLILFLRILIGNVTIFEKCFITLHGNKVINNSSTSSIFVRGIICVLQTLPKADNEVLVGVYIYKPTHFKHVSVKIGSNRMEVIWKYQQIFLRTNFFETKTYLMVISIK